MTPDALVSAHRMAGLTGSSRSSVSTTPCIWPDRPIAEGRPAPFDDASDTASLTAATVSRHQAWGSDSAQPGCGDSTGYGRVAIPRVTPLGSVTTAFTELVPRSTPSSVAAVMT